MTHDLSAEFRAAFRRQAGDGPLSFADFMNLALYDPFLGYYRRPGPRIGYGPDTDFFTASSSGPAFGGLVVAACQKLLGERDPAEHAFVEIGAETAGGILAGRPHPFLSAQGIGPGAPLRLSGPTVVFSNELFDAQPFRRFHFRAGAWRERGVALKQDRLIEVELDRPIPAPLPAEAPEGYVIDAPLASVTLLDEIAGQPWTGLFLAFDYGKSWAELSEATPAGTARAYRRHVQSNDLLAHPGEQDLTCHVCWDWLADSLRRHGFTAPTVESQEAFFVHHAGEALRTLVAAPTLSPQKRALTQLLHPDHLGRKFQVLHAVRP